MDGPRCEAAERFLGFLLKILTVLAILTVGKYIYDNVDGGLISMNYPQICNNQEAMDILKRAGIPISERDCKGKKNSPKMVRFRSKK
jgi:hypothetical protein